MADELFKGLDTPLNLMAANTKRDKVVGQDELGRTIYETLEGYRYVADTVKAPTSIPETAKAAYNAVPPMEDWRLPTAGEVVNAGKSALQSAGEEIWNLVSAPTNPNATMGDVIGIVSSMGSPAAVKTLEDVVSQGVDVYDPTTLRMFFGPDSPKADLHSLDEAKGMEDKGFTPQEVWMRTGWWNSRNGWRFEIDDSQADLHPTLVDAALDVGASPTVSKLEPSIFHDDFFEALPENSYSRSAVENSDLRLSKSDTPEGGFYSATGNINLSAATPKELRDVLMHELQHFEQTSSGAPSQGANPGRYLAQIDSTLKQLPREALEYLAVRREIELLNVELMVRRDALKNGMSTPTDDPFGIFNQMDLEQYDYSIEVLKRQSADLQKDFEKEFSPDFKKSLDDLYVLTGGFTDLVKDHDGSGIRTRVSPQERGQKLSDIAFDLYQRNVGEAEARLTAKRKDLTPVKRSLRFPEEDYDVDPNTLISDYDLPRVLGNIQMEWENFSSSKPRFAEGGVVENSRVDPVSGNPVPPGATPKEVRDDVDIKASEGEYIIPANVVRYLGLDKIEKMVNQAKEKLAEMQSNGRMGGEKGGEDDLPFGPEELMTTDGGAAQEKPRMAVGGLVTPAAPATPSTWNQEIDPVTGKPKWAMFFDGAPPSVTPTTPTTPTTPNTNPNAGQNSEANTPKIGGWSSDERTEKNGVRNGQGTTGIAGSVDTWTPRDFVNYNRQKNDPATKLIQGGIATMMPMGGLMVKARNNYLERRVPEALESMLKSGKDLQGNPLSDRDKAALRQVASQNAAADAAPQRKGLSGLFEGLTNKLSGKGGGERGTIGSKTSGGGGGERKAQNPNAKKGESGSISFSANRTPNSKPTRSAVPDRPSKTTSKPSSSKSSNPGKDRDNKSGRR